MITSLRTSLEFPGEPKLARVRLNHDIISGTIDGMDDDDRTLSKQMEFPETKTELQGFSSVSGISLQDQDM